MPADAYDDFLSRLLADARTGMAPAPSPGPSMEDMANPEALVQYLNRRMFGEVVNTLDQVSRKMIRHGEELLTCYVDVVRDMPQHRTLVIEESRRMVEAMERISDQLSEYYRMLMRDRRDLIELAPDFPEVLGSLKLYAYEAARLAQGQIKEMERITNAERPNDR